MSTNKEINNLSTTIIPDTDYSESNILYDPYMQIVVIAISCFILLYLIHKMCWTASYDTDKNQACKWYADNRRRDGFQSQEKEIGMPTNKPNYSVVDLLAKRAPLSFDPITGFPLDYTSDESLIPTDPTKQGFIAAMRPELDRI